jgi:DNA polymerase I
MLCFEYADQVPPEFVVDWELMLEKSIKQPISRIIEALGWEWNDVDPSRTTLAQWGFG